jgi:hypothetical protein
MSISLLLKAAESELLQLIQTLASGATKVAPAQTLESKDFWTTKELVARGWSEVEIDAYVKAGKLNKVALGGRAGNKYPTDQLLAIKKAHYS